MSEEAGSWWSIVPESLRELRQFPLLPLIGLLVIVAIAAYTFLHKPSESPHVESTQTSAQSQTTPAQAEAKNPQNSFNASNLKSDNQSDMNIKNGKHSTSSSFSVDHVESNHGSKINIQSDGD